MRTVKVLVLLAALCVGSAAFAAVDTATRRASVLNMTGFVLPVPDGAVGTEDRPHLANTYGGLTYEAGGGSYDLTGIPTGWYTLPNVLGDQEFVALMREEATNGGGDWAYWQPGTDIRGTSQLRLNLTTIIAEADGAAVWARWSPGTTARATGNLQLNMQEALNSDFQ